MRELDDALGARTFVQETDAGDVDLRRHATWGMFAKDV